MHEPVIPAENTRCRRCGGLLEMSVDPDQMVCPPQEVGVWDGVTVGVLVGVRVGVVVGRGDGTVGSLAISGSESSHPTAATIRRTNSPTMMPRVVTPVRCLNCKALGAKPGGIDIPLT